MKTIIHGNARFTVIENGTVRMEYAEGGRFLDDGTLFTLREYTAADREAEVECTVREEEGGIFIETPLIRLTYRENGRPLNRRNLTARLFVDGRWEYWYPAKKNARNLGGAMSTLDGVSGRRELPPGLIALDGWHMIDDSRTSVLKDGWICERDSAHICDYYLFVYGRDYKGALSSLARVSGKAALPRKCTFGSWYSRWHPYTADDFREIVRGYEDNDYPLDILVIDMDWHHNDWQTPEDHPRRAKCGFGHAGGNLGWTGYSWNERLIPDKEAMLREFKDKGICITLNDHPCDGVRSNEECYPEFANMLGLREGENPPFLCGDRKYMEAFFSCALAPNEKLGVDFWWLDWQQDHLMPNVPGVKGQKVLPWLNYLYYKHSEEGGKRGASYSRWGGYGDQRHPMYFSGDTVTLWTALEFEIEMTGPSANSMCFWWGHDIGGFAPTETKKEPEMYARWVQFGITTAALKIHSCWDDEVDRRPWLWESPFSDVIRDMYHLRSRLIPMLYSAAYRSYSEDCPFVTPLYYEYPYVDEAYNNPTEYMLGGCLLAAPIYTPGEGEEYVAEREVWLPEGDWYNVFTGERREGRFTERCPLSAFPLYARAGVPIPLQPYRERMTSAPLTELDVVIFVPEDGACGEFCLYEDDGITNGYKTGESLITTIRCCRRGGTLTVSFTPEGDGYEGMVKERSIRIGVAGAALVGGETDDIGLCPISFTAPIVVETEKSVTVELQLRL